MTKQSITDLLRRLLTSLLRRLESAEEQPASARAKPERWYQKEFHLPPVIVGVTSSILLYAVLALNAELTGKQAFGLAMFVAILAILFTIYLHRDQKDLVKNDDAMALLSVLFFTTLIWIKMIALASLHYTWITPYATPVALAPLLAALLLNPRLAMVTSFVVALVFGVVNDFSLSVAMVGAIGGTTIVAAAVNARTAHNVARAGLLVGIVQAVVVAFLAVMQGWSRRYAANAMASAFVGGIASAMFALGVLPYLESFFSRISNLRLVELASANHPLLQRMSMEAPGTYHHSQIVASLAEDAGNAIGANGLLCRVGALFHDIGKMVKAEYFIENQGTFRNPHDQVSPSLSKLVITSHVKEGIALARAHRLDKQIMDFIPQHHGTSQIEYFYQKALKLEENEDEPDRQDVSEETYRYPGPKPQSKEAGIIMLADSVEATSRTLEEPNHQRFKDVVHKIINKKLFDGQLDETPLTLRDLHVIAERFTASLISIHHARIAYPEPAKKKEETPFQ
jgi:putative nucleotidyltransferase with HDIG domain